MVTFPNCKINLGLNILQKREDGYHNIETVFFPIPFTDILEIISSENKTELNNTGIYVGENENNLCLKAFYLLKKDFPQLPEIKIHLHKVIPLGAGLGGGSADAVFTLLLLNEKYKLNISEHQLFVYASLLGSDCPFFLLNKPCIAIGRGEKMKAIHLSLSSYKILLINPGIHVNTKEMFEKITPVIPSKRIKEIIKQPVETWKNNLKNNFEEIVFLRYQEIENIKKNLYNHQAVYASMTGTGSTVFAIFNAKDEINYPVEKKYFYKWIDGLV
jgi:4-diphosphocytidyl-2-C-methyl-D-erythritol kinase